MVKITVSQLQKYLQTIRDLERELYTQDEYIKNINKRLYDVRHPHIYSLRPLVKPRYVSLDIPESPILTLPMGAIVGAWFGFMIFLESLKNFGHLVLYGAAIGAGIGLLVSLLIYVSRKSTANSEAREQNDKIRKDNQYKENKNAQTLADCESSEPLLMAELSRARQKYAETKAILEKYYARNIIYPKYRGLVPVTMFCEYFESGRCKTLKGHEGAYNIYESESRADNIIVKLNEAVDKLDSIKENQYMLANLLKSCQRDISSLSKKMDEQLAYLRNIAASQAASEYYDRLAAENTGALLWLDVFDRLFK